MDTTNSPDDRSLSEKILEHHGIKGMRWGVRRSKDELSRATATLPDGTTAKVIYNKKTNTAAKIPSDVLDKEQIAKAIKTYGTSAVNTKDLQMYVNRVRLERSYAELFPQPKTVGQKVGEFVKDIGKVELAQAKQGKQGPLTKMILSKSGTKTVVKK